MYFPRLCVPIAAVVAGLVDLLVSSVVLVVVMPLYGIGPGRRVLLVVPFMRAGRCRRRSASACGSRPLTSRYRDVQHVVPFLLQLWLFASPVAYPIGLIPEQWRVLYALNPMAGVMEGFRWALLGSAHRRALVIARSRRPPWSSSAGSSTSGAWSARSPMCI